MIDKWRSGKDTINNEVIRLKFHNIITQEEAGNNARKGFNFSNEQVVNINN